MKEMSQSNILDQLKDKIYLIAGDASPRKFYRFNRKKQLLVYCSKDKKNNLLNYFKKNGHFRCPIYHRGLFNIIGYCFKKSF